MLDILLVDDEFMIKRGLAKMVEQDDRFRICGEAEDGAEALRLAIVLKPALIITDIRMPEMDGLELMQAIREQGLRAEIVILSGYDDFSYAQQAIRHGAFDYLLKPIKPAVFSAMLDKLAERLAGTRLSSERRSKWLVASRDKVGPFAETVWLLKEDEVERELGAIYRDLSELTDDGEERRSMLADFTVLAVGELEAKQHEPLPLPPPMPADWPAADGELLEAANSFFERLMNMLRETRRWSAHHHLYRAVEHMKSHFAKPDLDLQEAADLCEMSPSYFSRVFKQELGVSFVTYLTQLRLDEAKRLLEDSLYKTYEVANKVGYEDYPHFAKLFKRLNGVSPTEYRKRLGFK